MSKLSFELIAFQVLLDPKQTGGINKRVGWNIRKNQISSRGMGRNFFKIISGRMLIRDPGVVTSHLIGFS